MENFHKLIFFYFYFFLLDLAIFFIFLFFIENKQTLSSRWKHNEYIIQKYMNIHVKVYIDFIFKMFEIDHVSSKVIWKK